MKYRDLVMGVNEFQKDSLNSLSPYIGRLRPECAQFLIERAIIMRDGLKIAFTDIIAMDLH